MAKKDDYLEGYAQGLTRGKEPRIIGEIDKTLDSALGNPHASARTGLNQGFDEMRTAQEAEKNRANAESSLADAKSLGYGPAAAEARANVFSLLKRGMSPDEINSSIQQMQQMQNEMQSSNPTGMKKGGKVKAKKMSHGGSSKVRGHGIESRGKTKGRFI